MIVCRRANAPIALLAAFSLATHLAAQWQLVPALNPPPLRFGFTLTPLPNGELLLFGGDINNPAATEYAWNGVEWRSVTTPVPRRLGHAMAVDGTTGALVLHGGLNPAGGLYDTWTYDGNVWTQIITANAPGDLSERSMAFDSSDGSMVLVGTSFTLVQVETWRLSLGNWSQVTTATLPPVPVRVFHDTVRGELAAFAVDAPGLRSLRLRGGVWEETSLAPHVLPVNGSLFASFDDDRGRLTAALFGLPSGVTYEWDGLAGAVLSTGTPPLGFAPAMAYHPARKETVFVSGTAPLTLWRWAPNPAPQATAYGTPCQDPTFRLGLVAGDMPQVGASHRLRAEGQNGSFVTVSLLGPSHTTLGGTPLPLVIPLGALGCQLRVDPLLLSVLGTGLPTTQLLNVPASSSLLGQRYDAQCLQLDASGVLDTSNGLEVQIGLPLPENALVETFASAANRDAAVSGDRWNGGNVVPVALGGDGRHGSFNATIGSPVASNVYEWNTDNLLIPASITPSGLAELVTDGRFYFTDFVVPAGVEVRFVGTVPAQIRVRGKVEIQGVLRADAAQLPFWLPVIGPAVGQQVSVFDARGGATTTVIVEGQPGGAPGCGGGRGGQGGRECAGTGPAIVSGVLVNNGQPGQDVRLLAGHAYAGAAAGTGGAGSTLFPANGLTPSTPIISPLYRALFTPGGSGGGFSGPGGGSTVTPLLGALLGSTTQASAAFALLPLPVVPPPGYSSLDHFSVGGSGGGGGGSHPFGTQTVINTAPGSTFLAGSAGTGGGGVIVVRAGGDLNVGSGAVLSARGGAGVLINGDRPTNPALDLDYGVSSPGGGGSGGSLLLQTAASAVVVGQLDVRGSAGSRTGVITPNAINIVSQAGAGAPGFYRLEAAGTVSFTGTGLPAYNPSQNLGPLTDTDALSGSRSLWLLPPSPGLPVYLRYELVVDVAGATVLYSDDPTVSLFAANDPNGAALLRFQGARLDGLGNVIPSTVGPWRTSVVRGGDDSLNRDRATALRFDLVLNKSLGSVIVRELRVYWR